jgi:uncharacterized membrane protein
MTQQEVQGPAAVPVAQGATDAVDIGTRVVAVPAKGSNTGRVSPATFVLAMICFFALFSTGVSDALLRLYLAVFKVSSFGCDQIPEHSFFWNGYQFPICARCSGVLLGAGLFVGFFLGWKRLPPIRPILSAPLLLPLIIDGAIQLGSLTSWANGIRLLTGILFSWGAIMVCLNLIEQVELTFELTGVDFRLRKQQGAPALHAKKRGD